MRERIYYILHNIFVFFYLSDLCIEALTENKNMTRYIYLPEYGKFPGYGRPGIKTCKNLCRNPGYVSFQHHTLLHCTTIGRRDQIYRQVYNIYTYAPNLYLLS